ncbi:MAG: DUF2059 domain-containing protein, partial [Burkholderiales bacterium]|nr:DUF2059 domain-containing protein [Burkholderiales bacterium]
MPLLCGALLLSGAALAQTPSAASPAKKELVQKLLTLQQPGIEAAARNMVERPAAMMLQEAGRVLQTQFPADKREGIGKTIEADAKRYVDEAFPPVRDRALKLAPTTIGAALEEKFSEDELKQLVAWFESPVNKKFQQVSGEMFGSFMQKLGTESRPLIEPKLQTLEQKVRTALGAPAAPGGAPA